MASTKKPAGTRELFFRLASQLDDYLTTTLPYNDETPFWVWVAGQWVRGELDVERYHLTVPMYRCDPIRACQLRAKTKPLPLVGAAGVFLVIWRKVKTNVFEIGFVCSENRNHFLVNGAAIRPPDWVKNASRYVDLVPPEVKVLNVWERIGED